MKKVLLILVDGMRPDMLTDIPEAQELMKRSSCCMTAQTVFPSVTLPCHMSLFHSVDPDRHGITDNIYTPQVRPIKGICEVLRQNRKRCAFFYTWEELRDLTRPDSLVLSNFISGHLLNYQEADARITTTAIECLSGDCPDFAFLYFGWPDWAGHTYGWSTEEYRESVRGSWKRIARVMKTLPEDYTVIVTADHGGHGRGHGSDMPEDMTIPVILHGADFVPGEVLENVSIKDLAPTIAELLDTEPAEEWEGRNLLRKN